MRFAFLALAAAAHGCGGSECVADLPLDCAPLYTPTFDQIFTRTLTPSCAVSGVSCHAPEGSQGGLAFGDADAAYDALLGKAGGAARVLPGEPACSVLIERIHATDPDRVMPRGAPLSEAERCVFTKWIANGAQR